MLIPPLRPSVSPRPPPPSQFFVIGHDCGHRSFSSNKLLEDIVGTLFFAPLLYPFEPWRIKHNKHHAITNMLDEDTAWHPIMKEEYEAMGPVTKFVITGFLGSPLKMWASVRLPLPRGVFGWETPLCPHVPR